MGLDCLDCHKKVELEPLKGQDVHSLGYYLARNQTCYSREFAKACTDCHSGYTSELLASQPQGWKGARALTHD